MFWPVEYTEKCSCLKLSVRCSVIDNFFPMSSTHRYLTMRFMLYTLIFSFRNRPTYSRISTLCDHYNAVHSIKGYVICCGLRLIKPRAMGKIFLLNEINNQNDGFRLNPFFYINSIVAFITESYESNNGICHRNKFIV